MKKENLIRNLLIAIVTSLVLQHAITVHAAFGDLDNTFSLDGITTDQSEVTSPKAIALQADGKILVVGNRYDSEANSLRLLLRRYNTNGTIDTSFGWNGNALTHHPYDFHGWNLFIQADGKIVVVGYSELPSTTRATVWRFHSNGIYDSSFGSFGRVLLNSVEGMDVAGYRAGTFGPQDLIVSSRDKIYRLQSNGTLYSLFGSGGVATKPVGIAYGDTITIRGTGIYLVGSKGVTGAAAIVKFAISGSLDQTFGNQGVFTQNVFDTFGCQPQANYSFSDESYRALAFQTSGKIITGGNFRTVLTFGANHYYFSPMLDRHQPNGDLDFSFNDPCSSALTTEDLDLSVNVLKVLADNKIIFSLVGGRIHRTTEDGFPDADFQTASPVADFVVQPDGKIVVVGEVQWNGQRRVRVSRYLP